MIYTTNKNSKFGAGLASFTNMILFRSEMNKAGLALDWPFRFRLERAFSPSSAKSLSPAPGENFHPKRIPNGVRTDSERMWQVASRDQLEPLNLSKICLAMVCQLHSAQTAHIFSADTLPKVRKSVAVAAIFSHIPSPISQPKWYQRMKQLRAGCPFPNRLVPKTNQTPLACCSWRGSWNTR